MVIDFTIEPSNRTRHDGIQFRFLLSTCRGRFVRFSGFSTNLGSISASLRIALLHVSSARSFPCYGTLQVTFLSSRSLDSDIKRPRLGHATTSLLF